MEKCLSEERARSIKRNREQGWWVLSFRQCLFMCAYSWIIRSLIQAMEYFPVFQTNETEPKHNLENTPDTLFSLLFCSSQFINTCSSPLFPSLSLSLVVFCVMEWLLRTWLLCLTLVDEVCLCLSALTCRNRDTAYSKINTQSRREKGRARDIEKRKEGWGGLKVDKCNKTEEQERGWSRKSLERRRNEI